MATDPRTCTIRGRPAWLFDRGALAEPRQDG